ncbi:hypothetical protein ACJMK2_021581 [Sinanodonta woodiana]|uniref:Protein tyrosine phosphatase type IVA 3 n=1 Tax=Sinanodonta woodiana TaxID=1069815 RepID=A0ABD3THF6_SINWO
MKRAEPTFIEYMDMKFLLMEQPTDGTINIYLEELNRHDVKDLVRVCEPTYKTDMLERNGIRVYDWQFSDGSHPPTCIVDAWIELLKTRFQEEPGCCIAVHCVAGLGRSYILVALALIERGMKYEDAVELIRTKRRGALNARQLTYLEQYRSKSRLNLMPVRHKQCILM